MPQKELNLRHELRIAHQSIRDLTIQVCDLHRLIDPLIVALGPEYDHLRLGDARDHVAQLQDAELSRLQKESLAAVDRHIQRLSE